MTVPVPPPPPIGTIAAIALPQDYPSRINTTVDEMRKIHCIYRHLQIDPESNSDTLYIQYVGTCKLADVFNAPDATTNPQWQKHISRSLPLHVEITHTGTQSACLKEIHKMLASGPRPPCNSFQTSFVTKTLIECVQNGMRFETQSEAARTFGVTQASISMVLTGKTPSVKGFTFRYVTETPQERNT